MDQGLAPTSTSVSRLQTFGDLIGLHIADTCEVGKPPQRRKAATLTKLKRDLGKELIGHLDRQKRIDYLFHRVEARLDGRPTMILIDQGWLALEDANVCGQLREWPKMLPKKNASVIFATQTPAPNV